MYKNKCTNISEKDNKKRWRLDKRGKQPDESVERNACLNIFYTSLFLRMPCRAKDGFEDDTCRGIL